MEAKILVINSESKECKYDIVKPFVQFSFAYPQENIRLAIKNGSYLSELDYYKYDFVIFDGCINKDYDRTLSIIKKHTTTKFIYYVHEWWQLPKNHPLYKKYNDFNLHNKISSIIRSSFAVLTYGNDDLVEKIKKLNDNVIQIDRKTGFKEIDCIKDKAVFGIVPDEYDLDNIKMLSCIHEKYNEKSNIWNKVQLVLVGFTNKELVFDKLEGVEVEKTVANNIWIEYEKIITNNYKICSPEYKEFLLKFLPNPKYNGDINKESYKRVWKQVVSDDTIYYNILLRPLEKNTFNMLKYSREEDLAKNTVINGKYVEVVNNIEAPKSATKKVLKQQFYDRIINSMGRTLFSLTQNDSKNFIETMYCFFQKNSVVLS